MAFVLVCGCDGVFVDLFGCRLIDSLTGFVLLVVSNCGLLFYSCGFVCLFVFVYGFVAILT